MRLIVLINVFYFFKSLTRKNVINNNQGSYRVCTRKREMTTDITFWWLILFHLLPNTTVPKYSLRCTFLLWYRLCHFLKICQLYKNFFIIVPLNHVNHTKRHERKSFFFIKALEYPRILALLTFLFPMSWKFPFFWSTIRLNVNTLCFFWKIQYANYSLHVVRQISTFSYLLFYEACRFSFVIFPRWVNLLSLREINVVSIKVN